MAFDRMRLTGELAEIVADGSRLDELPRRLCHACVTALPVDGVGLSLIDSSIVGGRTLLGASDMVGVRIEELQYGLGEGPCVSAYTDRQPVFVPDLRTAEVSARWPMFTHEMTAMEVCAIFALPLQFGRTCLGVLDCHRSAAGPLLEVLEALLTADAITMALLSFQVQHESHEDSPDLFELSWHQHTQVHLAIGMVAGQLDIDTDEALARLRAYGYEHDQTLDRVAADVVTMRLRLTTGEL